MKFILVFFITTLCLFTQAQNVKTKVIDTSEICMPYTVAQKILLDLNDYDKLKETLPTYQNEIVQLNKKVEVLNKEIEAWKKDGELSKEIIAEKNNSITIYKTENEDLKKENKRLKTKNGLYNIISAVIIAPLTYIAIFK
jgi:peptidoglycan hydrolase CwlO-like protein